MSAPLRAAVLVVLCGSALGALVVAAPQTTSPGLGAATGLQLGYPLEPSFLQRSTTVIMPDGTSTADVNTVPKYIGCLPVAEGTTLSSPAITTSDLWSSLRRIRFGTAITPGATAGLRACSGTTASQGAWRGNAAGLGGFFFQATCTGTRQTSHLPALGSRIFLGLTATQGQLLGSNAKPSSYANSVYFGTEDNLTDNWNICSNTSSSAACSDLGSNFPMTLTTDGIDFRLYAAPNDTVIQYYAARLSDPTIKVTGTLSSSLPATTAFLSMHATISNGTIQGGGNPGRDQLECLRLYLSTPL